MSKYSGIRLIAGLGNPDERHQEARHNAGFWFADALANRQNAIFKHEAKFKGEVAFFTFKGEKIWLLKPLTFMNDSGESLQSFADFYKIPSEQILVAHDEIDLANGSAKIKWSGGHGGHNGLRSIFSHLNKDFWRLRLGVGHPGDKNEVVNYVLKKTSRRDRAAIDTAIDKSLVIIDALFQGKMDVAMKNLHTKE